MNRSSLGLIAILIGTLAGTYGNSMANLVVPAVMAEFGVRLSSAVWLVTLYTLNFSVFMPVCGYLGSVYGYRKLYLIGMSFFSIACLGSGLASSLPMLLIARTLQGMAYAPILPAVMVMMARSFPAGNRGRAMGYWALVNGAAHASGPLISGFFIESLGWRSVFLANVPLGLACVFLVWRMVPPDSGRAAGKFDLPGAGLLSAAVLSLMLALATGTHLGWGSQLSLLFWVVSTGCGAAFIWVEQRTASPLVDLRLFVKMGYASSIGIISAESFSLFIGLVSLPLAILIYRYTRVITRSRSPCWLGVLPAARMRV